MPESVLWPRATVKATLTALSFTRPLASVTLVLTQVAEGVQIHVSVFCQNNTVVVRGGTGVLLVDAGVHAEELECLANDLADSGQTVVAAFSTHPHWDHMLWNSRLGAVPRYSTWFCTTTARERLAGGIDAHRFGIPEQVSLDLLGDLTGLAAGTVEIPWDGPRIRIIEHQAHAPGHAALFIEDAGVLVAGDMLSDVFVPMLDLNGAVDPIEDYLTALRLFEDVADSVGVVIPGHGSVGVGSKVGDRIARDRAYVEALRDSRVLTDPRVGPPAVPGWEFVADVHARQVEALARRNGNDGLSAAR